MRGNATLAWGEPFAVAPHCPIKAALGMTSAASGPYSSPLDSMINELWGGAAGDGGFLCDSLLYSGTSTDCSTSSITSSTVTPSSTAFTASSELPHCILRSFSGEAIAIL